jgi:hypothetical protein
MIDKIIAYMQANRMAVFRDDSKPYNLNIVGVRNNVTTADLFDDLLFVFWWYQGRFNCLEFQITTDPGKRALQQPIRVDGTGIVAPGQYRGAYASGLHKGKQPALVQVGNVLCYRDNNKDGVLDLKGALVPITGANIHKAGLGTTKRVGTWSRGCQVFANDADHDIFMGLVERAVEFWGNSFTYTLINKFNL